MNSLSFSTCFLGFLVCIGCASNKPAVDTVYRQKFLQQTVSTVAPADTVEQSALQMADSLSSGQTKKIGTSTVKVASAYFSASGYSCKTIIISNQSQGADVKYLLACKINGVWKFVINVQSAPPDKGSIQ